ncbi:type-F conjugative transfer system pilin assembly protein TrbC [Pectobacterium versatile]|uniref:type-F conjugative transfer system pilin assembly protein TrbC n=1 Tax=Pectobacterium versatile TaxID=2488639 RepID=UPI001F3E115C|nr:type-F conjugative transfer system pilin assembly protein TrbC [Pectobacterium versatile]
MKKFLSLTVLGFVGFVHAQNINISPEMYDSAQRASEQAQRVIQQTSSQESAQQIFDISHSDEFKSKQHELQTQVWNAAGLTKPLNEETDDGPKLAKTQLVMFVSSSMPLQTLRAYARDLGKVGGVMVFRGPVGGMSRITETVQLSRSILFLNPDCNNSRCKSFNTEILIDPVLFKEYGIDRVPALIYQPDININSYCDGLERMNKASEIIYGDGSVTKMLEAMNRLNKNITYETLLKKLQG